MSDLSGINTTIDYLLVNSSESGYENGENDEKSEDYDAEGAMKFIICTVVVYATFGVFCTLVGSIKRKATNTDNQDEPISSYLKREKKLKFEGYKQRLQYVCEVYSKQIRQYEEKMDLLDMQRRLEEIDLGLALNIKHKTKRGLRKKRSSRRPSVDQTIGRMGFSLLYTVDSDRGGSETEDDRGSNPRVHRTGRNESNEATTEEAVTDVRRLPPQYGDIESNIEETDLDV